MKINAREKTLLIFFGFLLVAFLYYNYFLVDQLNQIDTLKADRDFNLNRKIELEDKLKNAETLDQEYLMSKNSIIKLSNKFFSEVEQEEFIVLLNDLGVESKISIQSLSFSETDGAAAIEAFEQGRAKLDKYTELIAQKKIKGYVAPESSEVIMPDKPEEDSSLSEKPDASKVSVKPVNSGSGMSYADGEEISNEETEGTEEGPSDRTPENILKSEDPGATTYTNNIKALVANMEIVGTYDQIHNFVSLIAMNEQNIIVDSISIEKNEDSLDSKTAKNTASISLVFYKVLELEDYFEHKDSVLVKNVVAKSKKASPFLAYSWSFTPTSPVSTVGQNSLGTQITLPQPTQSILPPYQVYPDNTSTSQVGTIQGIPQGVSPQETVPNYEQDNNNSYYGSGYTRLPFGGYVQNPQPDTSSTTPKLPQANPDNTISFRSLSGTNLVLSTKGTAQNRGTLKVSDKSGLTNEVLKLDYHLGDVGYYGSIRIDIENKNIIIDKKATDLVLKIKSEMASGHNIGIEIVDADNMIHDVMLYEDIDWTDWKDVRLLNLPRMSYPVKVKSIYISRVEDVKVTDSVLYFDSLSYSYK